MTIRRKQSIKTLQIPLLIGASPCLFSISRSPPFPELCICSPAGGTVVRMGQSCLSIDQYPSTFHLSSFILEKSLNVKRIKFPWVSSGRTTTFHAVEKSEINPHIDTNANDAIVQTRSLRTRMSIHDFSEVESKTKRLKGNPWSQDSYSALLLP